jgi:peptidoglycan/LPS O-acetylase OafA/YrhL/lysophospholipase L1-like esterase
MKRVASLDFLRGLAAFAVAVPHYLLLNASESRVAEAVVITGVEVFFVLSGFVLAPQILTIVIAGPAKNVRIFLVRRWMRTIPPYLIALTVIAVVTGELLTLDFARYLFYVQNLFSQANADDFFPVAWSLSVEEWFYVTFAPLLFLLARVSHRRDWKLAATFGALFILAVILARFFADQSNWDAAVRRVTIFRLDSIAWGFLLFLVTKNVSPFDPKTSKGRTLFGAALVAFVACSLIGIAVAYFTTDNPLSRQIFPFAAAAVGLSAVFLFLESEFLFAGNIASKIAGYLGHISYSVYLFHLGLAMILKPRLANLDLAIQLVIYVGLLVALTSIIWLYVEKPILAARPTYSGYPARENQTLNDGAPAQQSRVGTAVFALLFCVFAFYCFRSYEENHPRTFYLTFVAAAALLFGVAQRVRVVGVASIALTILFFSILLPAGDYLFVASRTEAAPIETALMPKPPLAQVEPSYTFRAAKADPLAFHAWWAHYFAEWMKSDGGKISTEQLDPDGVQPFVLVPNSTGRFFDSVIHINSLGFRGAEFERDKQNRFRVFALGESPTFGPTLRPDEHPWPEVLQRLINTKLTCERPIEVINAGTEAYTLANNVERLRRDIVPLKPDIVISSHGYNGLGPLLGGAPFSDVGVNYEPQHFAGRSSALLNEVGYRIRLAMFRLQKRKDVAPVYSEAQILKSEYAANYRQLIQIARNEGFRIVLSTSSFAVSSSSPREVKDFYGSVFTGIDEIIFRNQAHNEMVRKLAVNENVTLIDTALSLDGHWDDDLYLDLVHFTKAGNDTMAQIVFDGLAPTLRSDGSLRCHAEKSSF